MGENGFQWENNDSKALSYWRFGQLFIVSE